MKYTYITLGPGVVVMAVTPEGNVVIIQDFRPPLMQYKLEFPMGGIAEGETPLEAAKRELQEETGYVSPRWIELGECVQLAGHTEGIAHMFLALDAYFVEDNLEDSEDITVYEVSTDELDSMILKGEFDNSVSNNLYLKYLLLDI